jgi:2,4-dienoyl-CoA reductase-like NADH-dependent reductase (Old Yellow Enzyme family)
VYENLFEPLTLGRTVVPNRVVRAAHTSGAPWVDVNDDLIAYHEARARGGVGLSILEIAGVHRTTATAIPVYNDRVLGGYDRIAAAMRPHGMKVFQQLWHGGSARVIPGQAPWSASTVPNPMSGVVPRAMTQGMIDEIVEAFGVAARRVRDGGLDGVEVHGAHGYLVGQFLSPATNRRTDEYGGPLENRVRFLREVLSAMRDEVGGDFPIGVRLSGDEEIEGGLHPQDTAAIVQAVEPLVDFVDVSLGSYYRFYKFFETLEGPLGYEVPTSEIVTRATTVPTMITGRIMTLEHASRIVAEGTADMVSMVRALIADPQLVQKAREGREGETRPCIGTNQGCVAGLIASGRLACVVNPTAGREATTPFETPAPAPTRKRVLVVGGGPAGLEAARTAAQRGHEVQLYEMTRHLGGQVAIAATAPHRADLAAITRWLADEVQRLGVKVHLQTPVDPELVLAEAPDEVVIATGSTPRRDGFQSWRPAVPIAGADLPHVSTSWDVFGFGGRAPIGSTAVVFDDVGYFEAVSVCDALLAAGATVTYVTSLDSIAARVPHPPSTLHQSLERLLRAGVEFVTHSSLGEITPTDVEVVATARVATRRIPADTVVLVGHNEPNRELADLLEGAPFAVHLIGDAASSRTIQAAIAQATALARSI